MENIADKNLQQQPRERFIFYRSFYEAIRCMPVEVQPEIYSAIMEYALFGITPRKLSKIAEGVFLLIRPNIDVNTARYVNGRKGGRKISTPTPPTPSVTAPPVTPIVSDSSFDDDVSRMKDDTRWIEQGVCMKFHIPASEAFARLDEFLTHCLTECADKPHTTYGDAQRHFCSWMRKTHTSKKRNTEPSPEQPEAPLPDYNFNGGFGGIDV